MTLLGVGNFLFGFRNIFMSQPYVPSKLEVGGDIGNEAHGANHPTPDERLDSWKEIARYLRRTVRTVQRWEQSEGLPVHRIVHEKRGTVYAYPAELDGWWKSRQATKSGRLIVPEVLVSTDTAPVLKPRPDRHRAGFYWLMLLVLAVATATALVIRST